MTVAVLIPWSTGCSWRERAWEWVQARYTESHPEWKIITGSTDVEGFSRTQAILDARQRTDADTLVVGDADVWCDGLSEAVNRVERHGWAIPHLMLHRLSPESTEQVYEGQDWRGLPLSTDNRQDSRPYRGHETDTLCVFRADVFDRVPPDPRFVGWGQEGDAWRAALHTLVGPPWRGSADLVHYWHPPQPRQTRAVGNSKSYALWRRYAAARGDRHAMEFLVNEGVMA